jgi:hypothetical protein
MSELLLDRAALATRRELPVGPLLCVINGTTRGPSLVACRGTRRAAA